MSENIITPQQAQDHLNDYSAPLPAFHRMLRTIATEPERTRAAVIKALEEAAERAHSWSHSAEDAVREYLNAIENGAAL